MKLFKITLSFVLLTTAAFCVLQRLPECFGSQNPAALAAAAFTLTDGTYRLEAASSKPAKETYEKTEPTQPSHSKVSQTIAKSQSGKKDKTGYYDSYADHSGEKKFGINTYNIAHAGTRVGYGYIKNKTGLDFDFEEALRKKLTFSVEQNADSPQVLIYHTHTSEGYLDENVDYYYESYYSRTQNTDYNVVAVGNALADKLNSFGISTMHDATVHDSTYNGSYDRSAQTIENDMEEHESIKVVLDIHRDALGSDDYKGRPVFEYEGKQGAQIMILSGCDYYDERGFENWRNNLSFALKLENKAEELYPGMTRDISFDFFAYNEYLCDGSLLIEIGTDANSIEEAEYSAELLADVLYRVLTE